VVADDAAPLRAEDAAGTSLFSLLLAAVLAAYLFSIASVNAGRGLSFAAHSSSSVIVAVLIGASAGLIAGPGFGVISGAHVPAVAGIVTLLALAVSATATALMLAWPAVGAMIASILLLIIGTASAGAMPGRMLPDWLHIARDVLPNGLALDAIRQVEYFDSHGAVVRTLGLAIWAAIPVGLITLLARRQER
jgi:hypothetical protein